MNSFKKLLPMKRKAFTLIELLVVAELTTPNNNVSNTKDTEP